MECFRLSERDVLDRLKLLNKNSHGEWKILNSRLVKDFVFNDFLTATAFMTRCSVLIEKLDHHPRWCNDYNKVSVELVTHEVSGISALDFELATLMDEVGLDV